MLIRGVIGPDKQWILNNREYHGKTITIQWMKDFGIPYDETKGMVWNWERAGGIIEENELRKFRYLYFHADKRDKQKMRDSLALEILPYPKGDNQRYDASYQPPAQGVLI